MKIISYLNYSCIWKRFIELLFLPAMGFYSVYASGDGVPGYMEKSNADTLDITQWNLSWSDEFDYSDEELENNWISQNGSSSGFVLCSRWRDNVEVHDGILEMTNRKESRGGQEWTSGSIWTHELFSYGYFEARYKYASATGTNNSFWLWPYYGVPAGEKAFELDINEGHYPNEVNTNIHNWTDTWIENGVTVHANDQQHHTFGGYEPSPTYEHILEAAISTRKIRFSSNHGAHFHIREFRVFAPNTNGYPEDILSETADTDVAGLVNHARSVDVTITASGEYTTVNPDPSMENAADGSVYGTSWIAQAAGEKWLQFDWEEEIDVGAIQFINGWYGGGWNSLINHYKIEYYDGTQWAEIVEFDVTGGADFSEEYHTYGLVWNETEFKFYFDGELFRTEPNYLCHSETNILLSLAILDGNIAGAVTDAIDGTSMKVDYVRYYTYNPNDLELAEAETQFSNASQEIRVYPNPARSSVNITMPEKNLFTIALYDVQGCSYLEHEFVGASTNIDIRGIPEGFYILKVLGDNYCRGSKLYVK